MPNQEHLGKLHEDVEAWNQWRTSRGIVADLDFADLAGKDLSGADLRGANLEGAILRNAKLGPGSLLWNAKLSKADLYQANLSGADLQDVNFTGADLFEANLREANLQGADLSGAKGGLRTEQLAGADLTGAKVPEQLKTLYDKLENVKGISESARKIFLVVLAACLYCWLTIATTTDVNLITNRASSPLPIIQTQIPIVGFYVVAPLLVLCVYFYFHFYLQKLWEELGALPAVFPDGRPLHAKVDPWLLNDLVRAHLPKLNAGRPFLSYFQLWISVLLAWWIVPITMFLFWGRYLRRHEQLGTWFHVVLLLVSLVGAVCLYRLAVATLRGRDRIPLRWKGLLTSRRGYQAAAFAGAAGVLFVLVSLGAIQGIRSKAPILGINMPKSESPWPADASRWTWVPRWMALIGYPPFVNLTDAEVSQKKSNWTANSNEDQDLVTKATLAGADLRYASAGGAFLKYADLSGADLSGADLAGSELSHANFSGAKLGDATLTGADLRGANLNHTDLSDLDLDEADLTGADLSVVKLKNASLIGANLSGADLSIADLTNARISGAEFLGANFWNAEGLAVEYIPSANDWCHAFYDPWILDAFGLPSDHNEKLKETLKKEKERQAQNGGQLGLENCPEYETPDDS